MQGPPVASHNWSEISFMSRGMSVRTNFPLARSSPPTRPTQDSVSALIPSGPPSRSYSDLVCVVICFPLPRVVRPSPCFWLESRLGPSQRHSADLLEVGVTFARFALQINAPAWQPIRATDVLRALALSPAPQLARMQEGCRACADGMEI